MANKKKALSFAVAHASMGLALNATAGTIIVDQSGNSGAGTLRDAIADASSGDIISINADAVSTITLDTPIGTQGKSLIIQAPVDAQGKPQVTITASAPGHRLLALQPQVAPVSPIPFVISGLKFSGAAEDGPGGAIIAGSHALVLDKSIVTGNTAVGVGGGVASYDDGELCLQGSEISGNTVTGATGPEGSYAMGGGAFVDGLLQVLPSFSTDDGPGDYLS